jgi:hypothetical protein
MTMSNDHTLRVEFDIDLDEGDETGRLIRPYAITGGRTGSETDISLEAQIQASTRADELVGA